MLELMRSRQRGTSTSTSTNTSTSWTRPMDSTPSPSSGAKRREDSAESKLAQQHVYGSSFPLYLPVGRSSSKASSTNASTRGLWPASRSSLFRPATRSSTESSSFDRCRFLLLPVEVRVCIYRYLLPCFNNNLKVYTDCDSSYTDRKWSVERAEKRRKDDPHALAILRANRMIYFEALSVLYSENAFHFIGTNFLPILDFIRKLSPDAKHLVRQLKITMLPEARHFRAEQLELFCRVVHDWLPGLNKLGSDHWVWI